MMDLNDSTYRKMGNNGEMGGELLRLEMGHPDIIPDILHQVERTGGCNPSPRLVAFKSICKKNAVS